MYVTFAVYTVPLQHFCDSVTFTLTFACIIIIIIIIIIMCWTAGVGPRLGQGAFGIVVRALAYGIRDIEPTTVVAVKMAKGKLSCLNCYSV